MALKKKKEKKPQKEAAQKPYFMDENTEFDTVKKKAGFGLSQLIVCIVLGFISGFIVWAAFVGSMVLTDLLWVDGMENWRAALEQTPLGGWWLPLLMTTLGGLIIGLWTKYTHAMPIPMEAVLAEVKKNGKFGYKRPFATIIGFLMPLVFGGAVGPEAGLTGLTSHACTVVGGALRRRGINKAGIADVSVSAAMAGMFGNPLVGIAVSSGDAMPQEDLKDDKGGFDPYTYNMKRSAKIVLYTVSAIAAALGASCFSTVSGASFGFPRFEGIVPGSGEWWVIIPCIALGFIGALLFQASKHYFGKLSVKMKDYPVIKPVIAGFILGVMAIFCPMVMFPGEEQLFELQETWQTWVPALLIATGLLKCVAAQMCLNMGWDGGGIFPIIYSGAALGYGVTLITGVDPMFCVGITTAVLIAGTQRKLPISIAFMLLAFPPTTVIWSLLAIVIGLVLPMPKSWFPNAMPRKPLFKKNMKDAEEESA